jgi:uncharacterized protein (TIRG00374 family)
MEEATSPAAAPHRRRVPTQVRWGLYAVAFFLIFEYLVLPQLSGARKSLNLLGKINVAYVMVAISLEVAAWVSYSQLTYTVLRHEGPPRSRLFRINMSSLAVSHIMPGGTAPGTAVAFRLLTQSGVSGTDAGFALAMQGIGSALVLNSLLWLALLISLFMHGYNPLYALAAGAGVLLLGTFAAVVVALTRGRNRSVDVIRRWAGHIPLVDGDRLAVMVQRVADRLRQFLADPPLVKRAVAWAAAFWLLDASSLFVFIAAFGKIVSPIDLLVAYGLAFVLAVIPITPSGLGVIEGVLIPTLAGFGVPRGVAVLGVLGYRLVNFWLPIPLGGIAYLSLRFSDEHWSQRLRHARQAVAQLDDATVQRVTAPLPPDAPSNGVLSNTGSGAGNTRGVAPRPPVTPREHVSHPRPHSRSAPCTES